MANGRITIGLVAPSRAITSETAEKVTQFAKTRYGEAAPRLIFHMQCFLAQGHFAGSDAARAAAFVEMANNPDIDVIWFARGGYGSGRLPEETFAKLDESARRKTYIGYSDTGMLLAKLYKDGIGTVIHGPLASDIEREGGEKAIARVLDYLIHKEPKHLEDSTVDGPPTLAFNMTVFQHLLGTGRLPNLSGHVLQLEEVAEHYYSIDRAMFTISENEAVRKVAGIRLGRCSHIPENDIDFGQDELDIVRFWCQRSGIPYLGRADIGHDIDNKLVVFGRPT